VTPRTIAASIATHEAAKYERYSMKSSALDAALPSYSLR